MSAWFVTVDDRRVLRRRGQLRTAIRSRSSGDGSGLTDEISVALSSSEQALFLVRRGNAASARLRFWSVPRCVERLLHPTL